jgi:hypothetical protein
MEVGRGSQIGCGSGYMLLNVKMGYEIASHPSGGFGVLHYWASCATRRRFASCLLYLDVSTGLLLGYSHRVQRMSLRSIRPLLSWGHTTGKPGHPCRLLPLQSLPVFAPLPFGLTAWF